MVSLCPVWVVDVRVGEHCRIVGTLKDGASSAWSNSRKTIINQAVSFPMKTEQRGEEYSRRLFHMSISHARDFQLQR